MKIKNTKTLFALLLLTVILCTSASGQEVPLDEKNYKLYFSPLKKEVNLNDLLREIDNYDIVLFGEEHNDSVAHFLEYKILEMMYDRYGKNTVLSMEMFDRDVQTVLNEYLSGKIKETHFKKDARVWTNYKDYRSMIEFAKSKELKVIATNAPMRYVSIANRMGQAELQNLSSDAKGWIAPLPYDTATGKYYDKLREIMGYSTQTEKHGDKTMLPPSLNGHSLWDATMSYFIAEVFKSSPDAKVIHYNGRFHSDEHYGIYQQLEKYAKEKKVLVISAVPGETDFPNVNYENYKQLGDFIIITDPKVPKTF